MTQLILILVILFVLFIVFKIKSSQRKTKKGHSIKERTDSDEKMNDNDDFEDILLTGLVLGDVLDDNTSEEETSEEM